MSHKTNEREFLKNHDWKKWATEDHVTDARKGMPLLPPVKPYPEGEQLISLISPDEFNIGNMSVKEAINKRKSRRNYTDEPLYLEELSYLLWATQGVHQTKDFPVGTLTFRTVPSGGSLHTFETYLVISIVEGVEPGLYRYLPIEHKLLLINTDADLMDKVMNAFENLGNKFVRESAVFFIWTTIPYRMEYQYDVVAQKIIALDAGHVCQNLYMAAESIGAGVCAIGAFGQEEMDSVAGVDGEDEFVIYCASVGKVACD
ncbi:MAG: SagB/ThcOx family dehydrogenase [Armatimonadota bacterium]